MISLMGYGYYEIDGMKRGYAVPCKCHQRGCPTRIDRGLAYLCYRCGWYFCGEHRFYTSREFECFAGRSGQACSKCADVASKEDE